MAIEINKSDLKTVSGGDGNKYFQYVVKKGDTLKEIADKFDTTIEEIMELNPIIENRNFIRTGWVLLIPAD